MIKCKICNDDIKEDVVKISNGDLLCEYCVVECEECGETFSFKTYEDLGHGFCLCEDCE